MENFELLEPERLYKESLKEEHNALVTKTFDELTKKSGVDIEGNKITCASLHKHESLLAKAEKSLNAAKGLKVLFIVMLVLGVVMGVIGGVMLGSGALPIVLLIVGILLFVLGIVFLVTVAKKKQKEAAAKVNEYTKKVNELKAQAYAEMMPLNSLFTSSLPAQLFHKTCPLIEMDRIFDIKKYEMMREKFDMWDNSDENSSTLDIQSGSILGNPFVIFKDLTKTIIQKRYTGSTTISYSVGSGQNRHTVTETLRASYDAPMPVYSNETYLVYGNEAATKLSFSREPSNINEFASNEEILKYVRKHEKELDKLAEKQMKKGGTYTPIGNPEFELFFGGLDRDNEVEFRLLFTPLGQKSMMDLLKSKVGYGDDFMFKKIKGLNLIQSKHSQGETLFTSAEAFQGFEYEVMKKNFINYNNNYFKALFFDFAPLLSIPLYQQMKTHEYIYKDIYKSRISPFEHEVMSNRYNVRNFAHAKTKTDVILKTAFEKRTDTGDLVHVTAHSYDTINRIHVAQVLGGDGRFHSVNVPWVEYIPLVNEGEIEVNDIEVNDQGKFNSLGENNVIYANGLVTNLKDAMNVDIKKLKALMSNKED